MVRADQPLPESALVPESNIIIYRYLYSIENALRELIIERLAENAGPRWYKKCLPPDVYQKYRDARRAEQKVPWKQLVPHHSVYYLDFPDLKKTFENGNNWRDCFSDLTARKDLFLATLAELEPIRNKVAHCRMTSTLDLQIVEVAREKVEQALSKPEFLRLSSHATNAPELTTFLERLLKEACDSYEVSKECKPLNELPYWAVISRAWWFDESYFDCSLLPIEALFDSFERYARVPRHRGAGHDIEKWIASSDLDGHFMSAQALLINLLRAGQ